MVVALLRETNYLNHAYYQTIKNRSSLRSKHYCNAYQGLQPY